MEPASRLGPQRRPASSSKLVVPRIHLLFASEQSYSEHPSAVPRPLFHKA